MKRFTKEVIAMIIILSLALVLIASSAVLVVATEQQEIVLETEATEVETEPTAPVVEFREYLYIESDDINFVAEYIQAGQNYIDYLYDFDLTDEIVDEANRVLDIIANYEKLYSHLEDIADSKLIDVPSKYHTKNRCKSWERYTAITARNSKHYKLQHEYAYTGTYGIRMVDGRYCIAVGSYFTTKIGQYIDIILENGTIIPCILGDQKSDAHTDDLHIAHRSDGSVVEFIIDKKQFVKKASRSGDTSDCCEEWDSPVVQIRVYNKNIFNN